MGAHVPPHGQTADPDPPAAVVDAAMHDAIVRLSPWLSHLRRCARVTEAAPCDCGLQAALARHRWSI